MTSMHPGDRTYRNQTIRLADLTVTDDMISGVTFENCIIVGPSVIVLQGTTLKNSAFEGDEEGIIWDIGDRQYLLGVVALVDCTIVGCRFQRVGLAVPPHDREAIRRGLGFSD